MVRSEAETIRKRLAQIPGVALVTRGWPRGFGRLPAIAIAKAGETPVRFADDCPYVTQLEYYIRIFTRDAAQADALCQQADAAMEDMGYALTFCHDEDDAVRMDALRYQKSV